LGTLLSAWLILASAAVSVDERTRVPPCSPDEPVPPSPGSVVRLFELHKDHNPQNVLVVYTYADPRCRLIGSSAEKQRLVDMYWRMNARSSRECYKPTHPRIKSETLETLRVTSLSADRRSLRLDITPLDRLEHDLPTREAEIALEPGNGSCKAEVRLPLESGAVMRIREINARGEPPMGVPVRRIEGLELVGLDDEDRAIRRVYRSK
jgi:hypothetical protein